VRPATCNESLARDLETYFGMFDDPRELPRILISRLVGSDLAIHLDDKR
jgi:hypothetical protein